MVEQSTDRPAGGPVHRVAFVVSSLHGGGAEAVGRSWMAGLAEHGVAVTAIVAGPNARAEHLPDGVTLRHVSAKGLRARISGVRAILQELEADVVVSLQTYPNLVALAAARRISRDKRPPVVISERNLVSLGLPGSSLNHRTKIFTAKRRYRHAAHVVAISHPVAAEMISSFGVSGSRCTVVPNPALAKIPAEIAPRAAGERVQVVLPGRVVKQKRPDLALATVAELRRRGVDAELVSFGDGPLLDELRRDAERIDVPFVSRGWVEHWFEAIDDPAVVLLPSDREGFGNVLVEAAAVGIPVVAQSAALGVADAVLPGITGELAPRATASSLADGVQKMLGWRIPDVSGWLARFTPESSTAALLSVLELVVDQSSAERGGTGGSHR